jgi:hypothetical protein
MCRRDPPEGFFIALMAVLLLALALALTAPTPAAAAPALPAPGLSCDHATTIYTAKADRLTVHRVRVLELAQLPSGRPGAWVMPVSGPLAWAQFHVPAGELTECRP